MRLVDIDWGKDSAEQDEHLLEYFVNSNSFKRLAERRKNLIVGRKGSGKSALLKKLTDHFESETNSCTVQIAPTFHTIRTVLNDKDLASNFGEEIFFQHTWQRQICLDSLCQIGHAGKGSNCKGSLAFAREISNELDRTSKDFVENILDVLSRAKLKAGNLGEFGLGLEKELKDISDLDSLQHHLVELADSGIKFNVLIDDLDLGWDNSTTANNLLLGLLSAANYLSSLHRNIVTYVFLREDIYSILMQETQHSDKFRDVERLRWSHEQLVSILEERINFNRKQDGEAEIEKAFHSVFPRTVSTTNADNWLIERTLSRPRELIQLAKNYTERVDDVNPSDEALKNSESAYSEWKLDDLCTEYGNQYPGLKKIMHYWKGAFQGTKYHLKRSEIEDMFLTVLIEVELDEQWFKSIAEATDTNGMLKIFYEIGFLGDFIKGGGGGSRTYYAYQGHHEPVFEEVQVHPCFRKAVKTVERIRNR